MPSTKVEQTRMFVLLTRRGISCIFSPSHKDKARCAQLSRPHGRASELPLALAPSDTANLFADAAGGVRFRARRTPNAAALLYRRLSWRQREPGFLASRQA